MVEISLKKELVVFMVEYGILQGEWGRLGYDKCKTPLNLVIYNYIPNFLAYVQ